MNVLEWLRVLPGLLSENEVLRERYQHTIRKLRRRRVLLYASILVPWFVACALVLYLAQKSAAPVTVSKLLVGGIAAAAIAMCSSALVGIRTYSLVIFPVLEEVAKEMGYTKQELLLMRGLEDFVERFREWNAE